MRRRARVIAVMCALQTTAARAQEVPATTSAPAAPLASAPAQAAATKPPTPLEEAHELVEVEANTLQNLRRAIALYEQTLIDASLPARVRADGWADTARAWLRIGDLEAAPGAKIAAYEKGRAAGARGLAIDAQHTEALFWDMANLASLGRTKGVMNSLFMLPELRKGLGKVLALDPNHHYARQTLGEIDHAVPGIAGGSDGRAEQAYLEVLRRDPAFTPSMVNLAELYRDQGKKELARSWAQKVLDVSRSSVPNDWTKFDKRDARQVLRDLG